MCKVEMITSPTLEEMTLLNIPRRYHGLFVELANSLTVYSSARLLLSLTVDGQTQPARHTKGTQGIEPVRCFGTLTSCQKCAIVCTDDAVSHRIAYMCFYQMYMDGGRHAVQRTDHPMNGLWTYLIIAQVLGRSLKTRGGLTQGRGMTESVR